MGGLNSNPTSESELPLPVHQFYFFSPFTLLPLSFSLQTNGGVFLKLKVQKELLILYIVFINLQVEFFGIQDLKCA